jgi:hypothetical protein
VALTRPHTPQSGPPHTSRPRSWPTCSASTRDVDVGADAVTQPRTRDVSSATYSSRFSLVGTSARAFAPPSCCPAASTHSRPILRPSRRDRLVRPRPAVVDDPERSVSLRPDRTRRTGPTPASRNGVEPACRGPCACSTLPLAEPDVPSDRRQLVGSYASSPPRRGAGHPQDRESWCATSPTVPRCRRYPPTRSSPSLIPGRLASRPRRRAARGTPLRRDGKPLTATFVELPAAPRPTAACALADGESPSPLTPLGAKPRRGNTMSAPRDRQTGADATGRRCRAAADPGPRWELLHGEPSPLRYERPTSVPRPSPCWPSTAGTQGPAAQSLCRSSTCAWTHLRVVDLNRVEGLRRDRRGRRRAPIARSCASVPVAPPPAAPAACCRRAALRRHVATRNRAPWGLVRAQPTRGRSCRCGPARARARLSSRPGGPHDRRRGPFVPTYVVARPDSAGLRCGCRSWPGLASASRGRARHGDYGFALVACSVRSRRRGGGVARGRRLSRPPGRPLNAPRAAGRRRLDDERVAAAAERRGGVQPTMPPAPPPTAATSSASGQRPCPSVATRPCGRRVRIALTSTRCPCSATSRSGRLLTVFLRHDSACAARTSSRARRLRRLLGAPRTARPVLACLLLAVLGRRLPRGHRRGLAAGPLTALQEQAPPPRAAVRLCTPAS